MNLFTLIPGKNLILLLLAAMGLTTAGWVPPAAVRYAFSLQASENRRYFVDQKGVPFLYHADTGWQLYMKLTAPEATDYLVARREQGFTAIQMQLATTPEDRTLAVFLGE